MPQDVKRVCIVTALAGPGPISGGVWEVVVNQARALMENGINVSIVAGWLGARPPRELRGLEVSLVPVRAPAPGLRLRALVGKGWAGAVARAATGADIAHVHLCRDLLTMPATRTIRRLGIPIVAQTHGMLAPPRSRGFRLFDLVMTTPAIRRVQQFITLTDQERPVLEELGVGPSKIATVPNAVPDPLIAWHPVTPARLLFAARLHAGKQVLVFAKTVARLRQHGHLVEGIIAGPDHGDLARLRQFIETGGHDAYIRYVGELDREQLTAQFATATAFVMPSVAESFGLTLVEAMSVGTPTVSTTETPLAEQLKAHAAAVVTPPNEASLSADLDRLLRSPGLQRSLSARGRAMYEANWTTDVMLRRLLAVYATALHERAADQR